MSQELSASVELATLAEHLATDPDVPILPREGLGPDAITIALALDMRLEVIRLLRENSRATVGGIPPCCTPSASRPHPDIPAITAPIVDGPAVA